EETVFVEILRQAGAKVVVYGHIHSMREPFVEGLRDGILYRNVAVDQVDFRPQLIWPQPIS
ncbi:MAG: hypothetical protein QHJ73_04315, partial [Armatimonadota bacterium]|nr:hypothetical protein [Armatimonadota bacterium]